VRDGHTLPCSTDRSWMTAEKPPFDPAAVVGNVAEYQKMMTELV
jgi:hypothetical protein